MSDFEFVATVDSEKKDKLYRQFFEAQTPYEYARLFNLNVSSITNFRPDVRLVMMGEIDKFKEAKKRRDFERAKRVFQKYVVGYYIIGDEAHFKTYHKSHGYWFDKNIFDDLSLLASLGEPVGSLLRERKWEGLNAQNSRGHTPLYCASRAGNLEIVKELVSNGADPDIPQRDQSTSLHVSSYYGHPDVVRYLIERGAVTITKNNFGNTPADEARTDEIKKVFTDSMNNPFVQAINGNLAWFQRREWRQINTPNSLGQTCLYLASKKGHANLVQWFLNEKADPNIETIHGSTALHAAAFYNYPNVVKILLLHGGNPTIKNRFEKSAFDEGQKHAGVMSVFRELATKDPVEEARKGNLNWFVQFFFFKGYSVSDPREGRSLLEIAISNRQIELFRWLLTRDAPLDYQNNITKDTALHVAAKMGEFSVIQALLERGANPLLKNKARKTPLEEGKEKFREDSASLTSLEQLFSAYLDRQTENVWFNFIVKSEANCYEKLYVSEKDTLNDVLQRLSRSHLIRKNPSSIWLVVCGRAIDLSDTGLPFLKAFRMAVPTSTVIFNSPIFIQVFFKDEPRPNFLGAPNRVHSMPPHQIMDKETTVRGWNVGPEGGEFRFDDSITIFIPAKKISDTLAFKVHRIDPTHFNRSYAATCIENIRFSTQPVKNFDFFLTYNPPSGSQGHQMFAFHRMASIYTQIHPTESDKDCFRLYTTKTYFILEPKKEIVPNRFSLFSNLQVVQYEISSDTDSELPIGTNVLEFQGIQKDARNWEVSYHGTAIHCVASILSSGFIIPGFSTLGGVVVSPPSHHVGRDESAFGHEDFAGACFFTPSLSYASHPCYAQAFKWNNTSYLPIFQCRIKHGSFSRNASTTPDYEPASSRDEELMDSIEWRVADSTNVVIEKLLLIPISEEARVTVAHARYLRDVAD